MINRYGSLAAEVYRLDKPVGHSFGDVEFYRERLAGCRGPVLEPAVGTGRVLVPLLEAGYDVRGFDTSPEMLDLCRAECRERGLDADLSLQGFADFSCDAEVEAVIVPAGSFQLVTDADEARAILARFREALVPGGRLILDLDPLSDLAAPLAPARHWASGEDLLTLTVSPVETDFVRQTSVSHLRYEHWRAGRLVAAEIELFALRYWGVVEFELALREAGFTDIAISGNYRHGVAPEADARIVTFEACAGRAG
ncbi:methyltransferase domain-containing protein [Kaustia mangrovi]|uniref:Methyltransferase domain-containing protein n=1 Tax=Kaustia mangrovi TaxID=2593653 RepID=A0A7S8HCR7_9HYPH|nr:class I SAM-dependent methyltransferase [Kaustia mangrovi]QPC43875.1 methyltransferase domain-containing protein [Kaustia mangrovi]